MLRLMQTMSVFCVVLTVHAAVMQDTSELEASIPHDILVRQKRSTNCAPKYQVFTNSHTACLPGSDASVVSAADQTLIVNKHNQHRAAANPPAANMLKMKWDDELGMIAQKWAEQCIWGHDSSIKRKIPGRFGVGQNLAQNADNWTEVVDLWHGEVADFTYGSTSYTFSMIGHYTQVMWATTTLVGCGFYNCNGQNNHVCNYGPAGNNGASIPTPYVNGTACSSCSDHCVDSTLCDCNYLACKNGGTINITTCTCSCQASAPLYKAPDCNLNCTGNDGSFCVSSGVSTCPGYADWCPHMCGVCPYAEDGYVAPVSSTTPTTVQPSTTQPAPVASTTTTVRPSTTQPVPVASTTTTVRPSTTQPGSKESAASREVIGSTIVFLVLSLFRLLSG